MSHDTGALLLDAEALYRELLRGVQMVRHADTRLVGITSGGAWLAERLQRDLNLPGKSGVISSAMHRDDFAKRGLATSAQTQLPFDVNDAHILILDDVLYTGRTIRAALDALFDHGRPRSVQLLTLIDRGHRELPIQATFVGRTIPTSKREIIEVKLKEIDEQEQVMLVELAD